MHNDMLISLFNNAVLLLAIATVYDLLTSKGARVKNSILRKVMMGVFLGLLGSGLILAAFLLKPGIIFDTRSVLLSISGLFFGPIPTLIAMIMTATVRLIQGGSAAWVGIAVIFCTGGIGLLWRHLRRGVLEKISFQELYLFGFITHIVMLALMFLLPLETALSVVNTIGLPVLLIYPLATVLLGLLLASRIRHKQTAAALSESEKNFHSMIETLPLTIYLTTGIEQTLEYMNPTFVDLLGYTAEDTPSVEAFFPLAFPDPDYRKKVKAEWTQKVQRAIDTKSPSEPMETVVVCKDGSKKNILWGYVPLEKKNYAYGLDLTEQTKATEKLVASAMHLKLAQSTARLGSWEQDGATKELYWSDMVYQLFGMNQIEGTLTADHFFDRVHPDDLESVHEAFKNSLVPENPPYDHTHRIIRVDTGEIRYLHEQCTHFRDADGNVIKSVGTVHDITERKQTVADLEQNRKLLDNVLNASPDMIWMKDPDGVFIMCNAEFENLAGVPQDQLIGRTDYDFFSKEQADACLEQDRQAALSKSMSTYEEPMRHATLSCDVWYETIKMPVLDNQGELLGVLGVGRNITDRRRAQKALIESEERLRMTLNAANQGLYDLNIQTGEYTVSPGYASMLGFDPETFVETNDAWIERLHPDDRDRVLQAYHDYAAEPTDECQVEFRQRTADGHWKWILSCGKIIEHSADGQPLRMLGTHKDISDRKADEEKLRESEERYRSTIDDLQVGVMVHAEDTRVVLSNPETCRMLGLTTEQIAGKTAYDPIWAFIREDGSKMPAEEFPVLRVMSTGQSSSNQTMGIIKSGHTAPTWIRASAVPIFSNSSFLFRILVNFVDITDQKKTEDALAHQQAMLESDVRERTKELRQIVNAMAGRENRMADLKLMIKRLCTQLEDAGMTAQDPLAKKIGNSAPEPLDGGKNERPA